MKFLSRYARPAGDGSDDDDDDNNNKRKEERKEREGEKEIPKVLYGAEYYGESRI